MDDKERQEGRVEKKKTKKKRRAERATFFDCHPSIREVSSSKVKDCSACVRIFVSGKTFLGELIFIDSPG